MLVPCVAVIVSLMLVLVSAAVPIYCFDLLVVVVVVVVVVVDGWTTTSGGCLG